MPGEIISSIIRGFVDYPFDQNASDELSKFISGQFTLKGNEDAIDNITKDARNVTEEIQDAYHNALSEGIEKNTYEEDQLLNDLIGKYGMSEVENALNLDTPVVVDVTDVNVNVNTDGIDDDIREQIEKALQDGNIDVSERNFLDNMFGADTVEQALEKYANYLNNSGSSAVNMPSESAMASIHT
ncbi:MAG TPA: hypothetical protein DHV79_07940, partial [Lachnospiraceae bacterium]|nr:hypothetical protein [Lachnospiraceae bacterium]